MKQLDSIVAIIPEDNLEAADWTQVFIFKIKYYRINALCTKITVRSCACVVELCYHIIPSSLHALITVCVALFLCRRL